MIEFGSGSNEGGLFDSTRPVLIIDESEETLLNVGIPSRNEAEMENSV